MLEPRFFADYKQILSSPREFLTSRLKEISSKRLSALGQFSIFLGIFLGSAIALFFSTIVQKVVPAGDVQALTAIKSLGFNEATFLEFVKVQKAYSLMLMVLSPILCFMAPHIFGGVLYFFMGFLNRSEHPNQRNLENFIDCANFGLSFTIYYALPIIGPFVSMLLIAINTSRAITAKMQLTGFFKAFGIFSAIYLCFLVASNAFYLLALEVATFL